MWFPEVMQSMPQARSSSLRSGVMPNPSAAFSTFATTKSMARPATSRGSCDARTCRPARPLTSPRKAMRMSSVPRPLGGVVHGAGLADDADAYRAGILDFLLDAAGDFLRQGHDLGVVDRACLDEDPHLLAGAHHEGAADAVEGGGNRLQAAHPLHESLQRGVLLAGARDDRLLRHLEYRGIDRRLAPAPVQRPDRLHHARVLVEPGGQIRAHDDRVGDRKSVV